MNRRAMPDTVLLNPRDFEAQAREVLPPSVYDYYAGGAWDEITVRENEAAWSRRRLLPRMVVDVAHVDLATAVLGRPLSMALTGTPTVCAVTRALLAEYR